MSVWIHEAFLICPESLNNQAELLQLVLAKINDSAVNLFRFAPCDETKTRNIWLQKHGLFTKRKGGIDPF